MTKATVFLCAAVGACLPLRLVNASGYVAPTNFFPCWSTGCWWIVESDYVVRPENNPALASRLVSPDGPNEYSVLTLSHRFSVVGESDIAGTKCWVVDVTLFGYPSGVQDDTKGQPLWVLYVRKDDGSLARYCWSLRSGPCLVTGDITEQGARDHKQRLPVVPTILQRSPLDIPLLPHNASRLTSLLENDKQVDFEDEWHRGKQTQRIEMLKEVVGGHEEPVLLVTISGDGIGTREQIWKPGYPWWLMWRTTGRHGKLEYGLFRARLLEWGIAGATKWALRSPLK